MIVSSFFPVTYVDPARSLEWTFPQPPRDCDPRVAHELFRRSLELIDETDEAGFDWISVSEHHFAPLSLTPGPMTFAAALTQRVKRAKIAMLGATLPLHNPVRVAEEIAMLDHLADGRLVVALLRGVPNEFVAYGIPEEETRPRVQEGVELILKAWTEPEPFAWNGRFHQLDHVAVWPRPLQQPHPPVLLSANSPESAQFAARMRTMVGISFAPPEPARQLATVYRDACAAEGWEPTREHVLYRGFVFVDETDERAAETLERYVVPFVPGAPRSNFFGTPDSVLRQLREMQQATGCGAFDLVFFFPRMPYEHIERSKRLFIEHLLPAVRAL